MVKSDELEVTSHLQLEVLISSPKLPANSL